MEGPTPVSALIHAATMVAAGVYLVGRFYPVFTPEVLLVIACDRLHHAVHAATIALTATDIKRVLAYSTVSQLGYMMLALGVGGWLAGMFHLFTHAFFKSLLFLCSGSVIHASGTNEMPQMGGLRKKMPYTAWTMLVGCLAIAGAGVPTVIGLSGYYSKDYIIAQALVFKTANPMYGWLFYMAVAGAGMTAFYMFRLWYMTFAGKPRDEHVYEHAHESPRNDDRAAGDSGRLERCGRLEHPCRRTWDWSRCSSRPCRRALPKADAAGRLLAPRHRAAGTSISHACRCAYDRHHGAPLAWPWPVLCWPRRFTACASLDPNDARRTFAPFYSLFCHKWWFDELYRFLFVRPVLRDFRLGRRLR